MDETSKIERMDFHGLTNREDLHPRAVPRRKHRTPKKGFLKGIKKGALRAQAKEKGMISGDEKLSTGDLSALYNEGDATTKKRVVLARNMKGWGK